MDRESKHPEQPADRELVHACKNGDTTAFEHLVKRYQKKMLNVAFRITGSYDDACDITQDAFLSAWRKIAEFRGEALFSTWLTSIVLNLSRNRLQQVQISKNREQNTLNTSNDGYEGCLKTDSHCKAPSALEMLEEEELRRSVGKCIDNLPAEFKEVVVLRDMQGFSYEEVRNILCLRDGTVKSRLFRARESIRDCLKVALGII